MDQRIRVISHYCDRFPTVKKKGYFDDNEIKHFIYQAMPTGLQQVFDQSGKTWFDDNLSCAEMVNYFHNVHNSYQHRQEIKRKNQQQHNQRPNKRINNISACQYNEFLQWQCLNMNQRVGNINNNHYRASRHSTQRTLNVQQRITTPVQTRQQACQNTIQRSNSSGRNPHNNSNNINNNNSNFRRSTNNTARRLFNSNDQYFNEEDDHEQQNDQNNNFDYNDQYFEDNLPQEPEDNHDPDEYINDDLF